MTNSTKHAPATPLPWIVNQRKHVCAAASGFADVATTADGRKAQVAVDDAAYIAHAANAYPRLVEALRDCLRALSKSDEFKVRHGSGVAQADALLRDLGEL